MDKAGSVLFFLSLVFFVPIGIAKFGLKASWRAIVFAFGLFGSLLVLVFSLGSPPLQEVLGWAMIFMMFLNIIAIPTSVLVLRLFGVR
jgi:hypothetical protein